MKKLADWFDDRTGYRRLVHEVLYEPIPGGARWRYVWGSTLMFLFSTQVVTGLFLWMAYSPSAETAWESVYFIQHEMQAGWLLRGIHHYSSQAMIVMLALHVLQVVWYGAYRAPREINWVLGVLLLQVVLGLALTGYLLPWDQKGYWATQVATKLASATPVLGPMIQKIIVGGPSYGHHTLTRFFALHAGLLPALLTVLLAAHIAIFRRHGVTAPRNAVSEEPFWPQQVLRDSVACLAVLAVILGLVVYHRGAELSAPAEPTESYGAARPEWYFLFLFQLLKYFPGESEIIGAIVIPGCAMLFLLLLPLIGRPKVGHAFCVLAVTALFGGVGYLTYQAKYDDLYGPESETFHRAVARAEEQARRIHVLVQGKGIDERGAIALLREDAKTQGPIVFSRVCAQCHRWNGHDGTGRVLSEPATCSDLYGFGSSEWRKWLKEFISDPAGAKFFGTTAHNPDVGTRFTEGEMAKWSAENVSNMTQREIDAVVEFLVAQSGRTDVPPPNPKLVEEGKEFFALGSDSVETPCLNCHQMNIPNYDESIGQVPNAPDLTGYGSKKWLSEFILDPEQFYGSNNEMPAYKGGRISEQHLDLLLDWMRGQWFEPGEKAQESGPAAAQPEGARDATEAPTDEPAQPDEPETTEGKPGASTEQPTGQPADTDSPPAAKSTSSPETAQ